MQDSLAAKHDIVQKINADLCELEEVTKEREVQYSEKVSEWVSSSEYLSDKSIPSALFFGRWIRYTSSRNSRGHERRACVFSQSIPNRIHAHTQNTILGKSL